MEPKDRHELTPKEQEAQRLDEIVAEAARRANGPGAPSIRDLFPDAIPIRPCDELQWAASSGRLDRVKIELSGGAAIDAKDAFGRTALHAAAENGHLGIARFLIENGADPGLPSDEGKTAAQYAEARSKSYGGWQRYLDIAAFLREAEKRHRRTRGSN